MSVSVGDIIELDLDSSINKLAKVIEVKKEKVEAIDLSCGNVVILPINSLFDKETITGSRLKPREEKELNLLGAKNLWVRLNPNEHKKYLDNKIQMEISIIKEKEKEENQIKFLKDLFSEKTNEPEFKSEKKIFPKEKIYSPLSKFIRKINHD